MRTTRLARVRLPLDVMGRVDSLVVEVRAILPMEDVSRSAVARALVRLALDHALAPELANMVQADTVRRGRYREVRHEG